MADLSPERREALVAAVHDWAESHEWRSDRCDEFCENFAEVGDALAPLIAGWLADERATGAAEVRARVEAVHGRYFDLDGEPGVDDTTPEPEDVWRYDRDLRAALNGGE